jgi:hypothetical protein
MFQTHCFNSKKILCFAQAVYYAPLMILIRLKQS